MNDRKKMAQARITILRKVQQENASLVRSLVPPKTHLDALAYLLMLAAPLILEELITEQEEMPK